MDLHKEYVHNFMQQLSKPAKLSTKIHLSGRLSVISHCRQAGFEHHKNAYKDKWKSEKKKENII